MRKPLDSLTSACRGRSPYRTPSLTVLGSMSVLTGAVGSVSKLDGGMGMTRRSQ